MGRSVAPCWQQSGDPSEDETSRLGGGTVCSPRPKMHAHASDFDMLRALTLAARPAVRSVRAVRPCSTQRCWT
eukprot:5202553-Prymnesium_polylepis.1